MVLVSRANWTLQIYSLLLPLRVFKTCLTVAATLTIASPFSETVKVRFSSITSSSCCSFSKAKERPRVLVSDTAVIMILSDNHGEIPWQVAEETLLAVGEAVRRWGVKRRPTVRAGGYPAR